MVFGSLLHCGSYSDCPGYSGPDDAEYVAVDTPPWAFDGNEGSGKALVKDNVITITHTTAEGVTHTLVYDVVASHGGKPIE